MPGLIASSGAAAMIITTEMNSHNWGNSLNRAPEMNFLIKAPGKLG
jgi:hypothetical protein